MKNSYNIFLKIQSLFKKFFNFCRETDPPDESPYIKNAQIPSVLPATLVDLLIGTESLIDSVQET